MNSKGGGAIVGMFERVGDRALRGEEGSLEVGVVGTVGAYPPKGDAIEPTKIGAS